MSDLGYLAYLAMILVPGYGFAELLGFWKTEEDLVVALTYVVGLGLSVDTVVIAVKTWGGSIGGLALSGFGMDTIGFLIAVGIVAIAISALRKGGLHRPPRITRSGVAVASFCLLIGVVLLLYFEKYPIFPQYIYADFHRHVQAASGLANGSRVTNPWQILYGGVEYQIAAGAQLVGSEWLVTAQRVVAILVVASPMFVFAAASRLFNDSRAAVLTTAIYAVSGTIWVNTELWSGLYANVFGILATLLLIVMFVDLSAGKRSVPKWAAAILITGCAYFSHYSTLSLLPSLLLVAFVSLRQQKGLKDVMLPACVVIAPAAIGALVFPSTVHYVTTVSYFSAGVVSSVTPLTHLLAPVPVLSYLAQVSDNDAGLVAISALCLVSVYFGWKEKKLWYVIPLSWLAALLLVSPLNVSAWRFAIEAFVPMTLLAGYGLHSLIPKKIEGGRRRPRLSRTDRRVITILVAALFLTPIVVNSTVQAVAQDVAANRTSNASAQAEEYSAMMWLGQNTPQGSRYLAVDDPQFLYMSVIVWRNCTYHYFSSPATAIKFAHTNNISYIIVTLNSSYYPVSAQSELVVWQAYQPNTNMTLLTQTDSMRVFHVSWP